MDVHRFRAALREYREALVGGQAQLSALTETTDPEVPPINVITISEIERGTTANPGIITVARLVEAMPGLTLSAFFRHVETGHPSVSLSEQPPPTKAVADDTPSASLTPGEDPDTKRTLHFVGRLIAEFQDREDALRRTIAGLQAQIAAQTHRPHPSALAEAAERRKTRPPARRGPHRRTTKRRPKKKK